MNDIEDGNESVESFLEELSDLAASRGELVKQDEKKQHAFHAIQPGIRVVPVNGYSISDAKLASRQESGAGARAVSRSGAHLDEVSVASAAECQPSSSVSGAEDVRGPLHSTEVSDKNLISAVLVEGGDEEASRDTTFPEAIVIESKRQHRSVGVWFILFGLVLFGVMVYAAISIRPGSSEQRLTAIDGSIVPTVAPSIAPTLAPTADYFEKINAYDYVTGFIHQGSLAIPEDSTLRIARQSRVRINATCYDGTEEEFGMIYEFGRNDIDRCVRLEDYSITCETAIELTDRSSGYIPTDLGFACGTFSGNATFTTTSEVLYDENEYDTAGSVSSSVLSVCESGPNSFSEHCISKLDGSAEAASCALGDGRPGVMVTMISANISCAATDLESSQAYIRRGVLFAI